MKKTLTAFLFLILSLEAHGKAVRRHARMPSEFVCESIAVWHEARNQSMLVQHLVLDVIRRRARIANKYVCAVLIPEHFPWSIAYKHHWKLSKEQRDFGLTLRKSTVRIPSNNFIYFNGVPHSFGKKTKKIGGLYFSE